MNFNKRKVNKETNIKKREKQNNLVLGRELELVVTVLPLLRSTERSSNRVMQKNSRSVNLSIYQGTPVWPPKKLFRGE